MAKSQKTKQREPQNRAPARTHNAPTGAYEVLIGLTYPSDPAVVARIRNGDHVPLEERGIKRVAAGEIVDDIPECSIEDLLARGAIERLGEDVTPVGEAPAEPEIDPVGPTFGDPLTDEED
jgi:hypothetical protein